MGRGQIKELLSAAPGGSREDLNVGAVPDGQWVSSKNWLVRNDEGQPRPGYDTFASVISSADRISGIGYRGSGTLENNIVFHSLTNAGHWDGASLVSITGDWTTSTATETVRMTTMESGGTTYLLRVNEQNAVGKWSGTGDFASISGAPTGIDQFVLGRRDVVLAADGDSLRVDWCGFQDVDTWSSTLQSTFLDDTQGALISGCPISPLSAAIFKEDSAWLMSLQVADQPFQFQLVHNGPGPVGPSATVSILGACYFLAEDLNVYRFDGVNVSPPVARGLAQKLQNSFSFSNRRQTHGFSLSESSPELWFLYPTSGSSDIKTAFSVNVLNGSVQFHEFANSISASIGYVRKPGRTIDDLTGTIDALTGTIDELEVVGGVTALLADTAGQPYQFGVALTDNSTDIAWNFYHGYRSPAELGNYLYLDGIVSYWKAPAASVTVMLHVTQSNSLSGSDTAITSTIELSENSNHLVTFPNREPTQWVQVGFSGTKSVSSLRHRGAAILGWTRAFT